MYKTIPEIISDFRTFADEQERQNIYDCRNLATDSLRAYADFLTDVGKVAGNIHALREALEIVQEMVSNAFWQGHNASLTLSHDLNKIVKEALAMPSRNCDRFDGYGDAIRAFEDETDDSMEEGEWLMQEAKPDDNPE